MFQNIYWTSKKYARVSFNPKTGNGYIVDESIISYPEDLMKPEDIFQEPSYFEKIDLNDLICDIIDLENINISNLNKKEIEKKIDNLFNYKIGSYQIKVMRPISISLMGNLPFFRIRRLINDNYYKTINELNDFYAPPKKYVTANGRLNTTKESILYLANKIETCVSETRLEIGEEFSLIKLVNNGNLKLTEIDKYRIEKNLGDKRDLVLMLIHDYLFSLFSKKVNSYEDEIFYYLSNKIAKDYYDLPPSDIDGWIYPSIAHNGTKNVAFRADIGRNKFTPIVAFKCKLIEYYGRSAIQITEKSEIIKNKIQHMPHNEIYIL